jgi:hypothetical protein
VLLARLQREREAAGAVEIDGGADEAAGQAAHELVLGSEHAEVGAAEAERHPEPLALAHDDVRALAPRRLQHAEVDRIADHDQQGAGGVGQLGGGRHVLQAAVEVRRLHDQRRGLGAHHAAGGIEIHHARGRRDVAQLQPGAVDVGLHDLAIEWVQPARQRDLGAPVDGVGHERGLGQRRGAVVDRRVGHVHAGQLGDHRLVLVDRAQRALAGLRLVGRVRGEELAAQDHVVDGARHVVIVGAGAEEAGVGVGVRVAGGDAAQVTDEIGLGQRRRQRQRPRQPRLGRNLDEQVLDPAHADRLQHGALVLGGGGQVAHQCPPSAMNCSYWAAVRSWSHSLASTGVTTIIQPRP